MQINISSIARSDIELDRQREQKWIFWTDTSSRVSVIDKKEREKRGRIFEERERERDEEMHNRRTHIKIEKDKLQIYI